MGCESEATKMRKPKLKFPRCRPPAPGPFLRFRIAVSFESGGFRAPARKRPARREREGARATGRPAGKRERKSILSRSNAIPVARRRRAIAAAICGKTIEAAPRFPVESGLSKGAL